MGAVIVIGGCVCVTAIAILVNLVLFFLSYFFTLEGSFFNNTYNAFYYLIFPLVWAFKILYWVSFLFGGFIGQFLLWLIFRPEFYKSIFTIAFGFITFGIVNFILLGEKFYPTLLKEPFEQEVVWILKSTEHSVNETIDHKRRPTGFYENSGNVEVPVTPSVEPPQNQPKPTVQEMQTIIHRTFLLYAKIPTLIVLGWLHYVFLSYSFIHRGVYTVNAMIILAHLVFKGGRYRLLMQNKVLPMTVSYSHLVLGPNDDAKMILIVSALIILNFAIVPLVTMILSLISHSLGAITTSLDMTTTSLQVVATATDLASLH